MLDEDSLVIPSEVEESLAAFNSGARILMKEMSRPRST